MKKLGTSIFALFAILLALPSSARADADPTYEGDVKVLHTMKNARASEQRQFDHFRASIDIQNKNIGKIDAEIDVIEERVTQGCPDCGPKYYQGSDKDGAGNPSGYGLDIKLLRTKRNERAQARAKKTELEVAADEHKKNLSNLDADIDLVETRLTDGYPEGGAKYYQREPSAAEKAAGLSSSLSILSPKTGDTKSTTQLRKETSDQTSGTKSQAPTTNSGVGDN